MGNKNGNYEVLSEETKDLLMQRTGEKIFIYEIKTNSLRFIAKNLC
jgi:hypothetical protein